MSRYYLKDCDQNILRTHFNDPTKAGARYFAASIIEETNIRNITELDEYVRRQKEEHKAKMNPKPVAQPFDLNTIAYDFDFLYQGMKHEAAKAESLGLTPTLKDEKPKKEVQTQEIETHIEEVALANQLEEKLNDHNNPVPVDQCVPLFLDAKDYNGSVPQYIDKLIKSPTSMAKFDSINLENVPDPSIRKAFALIRHHGIKNQLQMNANLPVSPHWQYNIIKITVSKPDQLVKNQKMIIELANDRLFWDYAALYTLVFMTDGVLMNKKTIEKIKQLQNIFPGIFPFDPNVVNGTLIAGFCVFSAESIVRLTLKHFREKKYDDRVSTELMRQLARELALSSLNIYDSEGHATVDTVVRREHLYNDGIVSLYMDMKILDGTEFEMVDNDDELEYQIPEAERKKRAYRYRRGKLYTYQRPELRVHIDGILYGLFDYNDQKFKVNKSFHFIRNHIKSLASQGLFFYDPILESGYRSRE